MTEAIKRLQEERTGLFSDLYRGKTPKRVPIRGGLTTEAAIEYAGMDIKEAQWHSEKMIDVMRYAAERIPTDVAPVRPHTLRNPYKYQLLGGKTIVMNEEGYAQHPEIHGLEPGEYPQFIEDPYKCMLETILPRLYDGLNKSPVQNALNLAKAYKMHSDQAAQGIAQAAQVNEEFGFATAPPGGFTEAPYDFMADFIRSFSGTSKDIRRHPRELLAACEAVTPIMINQGLGPVRTVDARCFLPLHMAPFLNMKQFEKFYWPTFKKTIEALTDADMGVDLFVEQDWTRYLDFLRELPGRIVMRFEFGDPKQIKEKLGDRHIIAGLYPIGLLKTESKEKCIDKAKELLDICAPGGGFIFDLDKDILSMSSANIDNLIAVQEYVREHGAY